MYMQMYAHAWAQVHMHARSIGVLSTVPLAGGYRQVAGGRWYWSHDSGATQGEINSFVDDACPQYLPHCADEDQ